MASSRVIGISFARWVSESRQENQRAHHPLPGPNSKPIVGRSCRRSGALGQTWRGIRHGGSGKHGRRDTHADVAALECPIAKGTLHFLLSLPRQLWYL